MATVESLIWTALRRRIEQVAGSIPVAWPGDGFTPGATAYLSVAGPVLPPMRVFLAHDAKHVCAGILPLVLRTPLTGMVYEVQLEAAGQIAAGFPERRAMVFRGVEIEVTDRPAVPPGHRDGSWFHQPINIPIRAVA